MDGNRTHLGRLISAPQTVLKNPGADPYSKPARKGRNPDGFSPAGPPRLWRPIQWSLPLLNLALRTGDSGAVECQGVGFGDSCFVNAFHPSFPSQVAQGIRNGLG